MTRASSTTASTTRPTWHEPERSREVWYLVRNGRLPDPEDVSAFAREVARLRRIPTDLFEHVDVVARTSASPLAKLRTVLSVASGSLGLDPVIDLDDAARRDQTLRLAAVVPAILARLHRCAVGLAPVEPDPSLGHAASYLYETTGERPTVEAARAVEQYMILTVDHGFNASTFTARVVASTGAEPGIALPPEARGVGLMFQDFALFPHLTAAQNVAFGLRGPRRARRERALELLGKVGMAHHADDAPHALSGGEQQRVALARALAPKPRRSS